MKKITFLAFIFVSSLSFGQATDLFFSMYGEGGGNHKWIEIYNGTGEDIDASSYSVKLFANGAAADSPTNTFNFEAGTIITDGDVFVIANSSADSDITDEADVTHAVTFYNGDDALGLYKNDVLIDVFGEIGNDPGSNWSVGSSGVTANRTLIRKSSVCSGNTTPLGSFGTDDDSSEWLVYDQDTQWDMIGAHTADCETMSTPNNNQASFTMYPNPSSAGQVFIQTKAGSSVEVTVFDILGKKVISKTIQNELNISGLKAGIYLVQVTNDGATVTKKLVVE